MECFRVIEADEGIEESIMRRLSTRGGMRGRCISGEHPALLVVSPGAVRKEMSLSGTCRTLLVPGDAGRALEGLRAASAVSYGTSPRDSLTVSSRETGKIWAALQREIVTVNGWVVERQEFPVKVGDRREELPALAVAGALLLLGLSPQELGE